MTKPAPFGRRGLPTKSAANAGPLPLDVALTPEQRAYLFAGDAPAGATSQPTAPDRAAPHSPRAGLIACLVVTAVIAGLTLVGKPHETVAALPPGLEPAAKDLFLQAGDWFTPLSLAWSIFVIASNLGANLWLTRKFCGWLGFFGLPAFAATGAAMSVGVAYLTAFIGLGDSEVGYAMEAISGAGGAAFYRLLLGRDWRPA